MDDFNVSHLNESNNEYCSRLVNILTPLVIDGFKSIYGDSVKLCDSNEQTEKYLMTFQNLIARIPNWNSELITNEKTRIINESG